jgi:hypothetical protein
MACGNRKFVGNGSCNDDFLKPKIVDSLLRYSIFKIITESFSLSVKTSSISHAGMSIPRFSARVEHSMFGEMEPMVD